MVVVQKEEIGRTGEVVLGLAGGLFGVLGALFAIGIGGLQPPSPGAIFTVSTLGWAALAFSVLGIIAACLAAVRGRLAGGLLLVSALGGLACISFFYILPFILLACSGAMCILRAPIKKTPPIKTSFKSPATP